MRRAGRLRGSMPNHVVIRPAPTTCPTPSHLLCFLHIPHPSQMPQLAGFYIRSYQKLSATHKNRLANIINCKKSRRKRDFYTDELLARITYDELRQDFGNRCSFFLRCTLRLQNDTLQFFKNRKLLVRVINFGIPLLFTDKESDFFEPFKFALDVASVFFYQLSQASNMGFEVWILSINNNDFSAYAGGYKNI